MITAFITTRSHTPTHTHIL